MFRTAKLLKVQCRIFNPVNKTVHMDVRPACSTFLHILAKLSILSLNPEQE